MANETSFTSGRDLSSVAENVELLTGQRGNKLDKAVTYRDLESLGVATLSRIGSNYKATSNPVLTTTVGVVDSPTKPQNVQAHGAFNTILIDWDEPDYRGHEYAEVFRAEVDNLSVAVKIGTTSARMYSDPIGGDAKVYYWVRFVNANNVPGPFNASAGTYAETAVDVQQLLDSLQGQIEESQLSTALTSKIGIIDTNSTSIQQITVDLSSLSDRQAQAEATNSAAIQTEQTARANADSSLSSRIDTVQATANNLTSSVQTQSQAISTLENGAQAMWTAKTQVGQITAGIGVMTDSNGKSQVMISASQLFVFDPNSAAPTQSLFAVSDGKVVIQKAVIEKATIETVTAMSITADYVRAGVSITSPSIVGGTLSIGSGDNSCFMEGGSIGIGKGGPYGGWGAGWHTIIYNDGGLYTDRLHASSGDFTGYVHATSGYFENVTIAENCNVLGTVYANKIVGDVVAAKMSNKSQTYTIAASAKTRFLTATAQVSASAYTSGYTTVTAAAILRVYVDGELKDTGEVRATLFGPGTVEAGGTASVKATIRANATHTYRLEWSGGDSAIPAILFSETSGSIY